MGLDPVRCRSDTWRCPSEVRTPPAGRSCPAGHAEPGSAYPAGPELTPTGHGDLAAHRSRAVRYDHVRHLADAPCRRVPRRPPVGPRIAREQWFPVTEHRAAATGMTGRSVVVLHAHPDDESIFTGVTIRRLADRGARVVLVTATRGEEGTPLTPLRPGESLVSHRVRELESACALLGVTRLVILGYRDSGMAGEPTNRHPRAFARQVLSPARRLVDLVEEERAEALVHYDRAGIYGHPDHVAVARLGRWVLQRVPVAGYEATVDPEHLLAGPRHLVEGSRSRTATHQLGSRPSAITTTLCARAAELVTKRRAMALYDSQVPREVITDVDFGRIYEREWFVRSGQHGILDEIADEPVGRISGAGLSA